MVASALIVLACLASLSAAAPAEQGVEIVRSIEVPSEDSYSHAASNPQVTPLASGVDPGAPDHALAPPPADHVAPVARHLVLVPQEEEQQELVRDKRQFGYGGYGGRRGYGRRHRYGGYGGYGGGYGGYPGGYGGGYGGYPGGYGGGYGGYPGGYGGFGGGGAQSSANAQSFSVGGGFGPFQGSFSSSQASSSAGGFGFGR